MSYIDKILLEIETHIKNKTYKSLETNTIELKDLSNNGSWDEFYKSVCAFLNSQGGVIIVGINEKVNEFYKFTGYNSNDEPKIKSILQNFTTKDKSSIDFLNDYIPINSVEIKPFLTGQVCVVYIEKLPEDKKYVYFKNQAYERNLTGDSKISEEKIIKQDELIEEIKYATELDIVADATLDDLDVDILNDYIERLRRNVKIETIKADISSAMSFLIRKKFVRENKPTLLGMLVCGKHIFDVIGGKSELDAYFKAGHNLADDKKHYKDNIIPLMESAWAFTFSKINVGVSIEKGGIATFEYPEDVIRETINNALAHRDYSIPRFSILEVVNNQHIEIRNPGRFKQNQLIIAEEPFPIRRIIPIPKAQNPNLADVLKVYNRMEGRGIGMATLVNFALDNQIDVPYYRIYHKDELGLFIPKGKVLDEKIFSVFKSFDKYIFNQNGNKLLTEEEMTVLAYFYKSEKLNLQEKFTINLSPDNNHFDAIQQLLKSKLITKSDISTIEYQLYQVDKTFYKTEFTEELIEIFGNSFNALSDKYKEVLQTIFHHESYSQVTEISANLVGKYLYFNKYIATNYDRKQYDSFTSGVRSRINNLEKQKYIIRKIEGKPNYRINYKRKNVETLFEI